MLAVRTTIHVSVCSFIWKRYWSFVGICIFILFMFILLYWISVFMFSADDTYLSKVRHYLHVTSAGWQFLFRIVLSFLYWFLYNERLKIFLNNLLFDVLFWITYCLMFCFKSFGVTYIPLSPGQLIYIKNNILYTSILWVIHRTVWQLMNKLQLCLL